MQYTANYQLPMWAQTDRILMEDFNDMTEALESALDGKGNCRLFTGSYVGTGTANCSFTFPEPPQIVMVSGGDANLIVMIHNFGIASSLSGFQQSVINVDWDGSTVTWSSTVNDTDYACNAAGTTYRIFSLVQTE